METKNAVLIIDEKEALYNQIKEIRPSFQPVLAHYEEAGETLERVSPYAVILSAADHKDEIRKLLSRFQKSHPETCWILSGPDMTKEEVIDYLRLGVSDFLAQPLGENEIEYLKNKLNSWNQTAGEKNDVKSRQIFSFFSTKGGVGVSMTAANFAVTLAKRSLEKVLMADFVLQHGNIAELLDITPVYTVHDLAENVDRVDTKLLDHSLQKHPSGLFVLPCPKHPEEAEQFTSKESVSVVKVFKEIFRYSVLDVGHELNASSLACLDLSDKIFVLTTPDLPSLCNAKTALETFEKLSYGKEKIKLVLNRHGLKGEINSGLIEKNLGRPIDFKISEDAGLALEAANRGVPYQDISKNSPLVKSIEKLADSVIVKKAAK